MADINSIAVGSFADARGALRFANDFDMTRVKRFYTVSNSASAPRRGWILHKKETKWFFPLRGTTTIVIEDGNGKENRYPLSPAEPKVFEVPPGHWFCIDQDGNAEVQVFSDRKLDELAGDDYRRPLL